MSLTRREWLGPKPGVLLTFDGDVATTPFAAACQYGRHGAVKVLLDHGADHTIANNSGLRSLHLAATFGCPIV